MTSSGNARLDFAIARAGGYEAEKKRKARPSGRAYIPNIESYGWQ